ncbi:hypothetical protein NL676_011129 [Syzygium grande]|nr:hypothetical protein NL676_011129 [Syzygium grande]
MSCQNNGTRSDVNSNMSIRVETLLSGPTHPHKTRFGRVLLVSVRNPFTSNSKFVPITHVVSPPDRIKGGDDRDGEVPSSAPLLSGSAGGCFWGGGEKNEFSDCD